MGTLTIKQFPERLRRRLKQRAAEHRRSVNREAIICLEEVLEPKPFNPKEFLSRVRAARSRLTGVYVTDDELNAAKNEGRL